MSQIRCKEMLDVHCIEAFQIPCIAMGKSSKLFASVPLTNVGDSTFLKPGITNYIITRQKQVVSSVYFLKIT